MEEEQKIGIYLCTCEGEIDRVIDIDSIAKDVSDLKGIITVQKDSYLCSENGVRKIREDVEKLGLEKILITACSPFLKEREFSNLGINSFLVERVNIREQCSRVHTDRPDSATKKAKNVLAVSLEKLKYAIPIHPLNVPVIRSVLVIGGGVAGINAAVDIAKTKNEVFLIEKNPFLGGKVAELDKYYPRICPPSCGLEIMFSEIRNNPYIRVMTSSIIDTVAGSRGNLEVIIKTRPRHIDENKCILCDRCIKVCPRNSIVYPRGFSYPAVPAIQRGLCNKDCRLCIDACPVNAIDLDEKEKVGNLKVGSFIVATGWEPYDPTHITELGYGRLKNVLTNLDLEKVFREQKIIYRDPKKVAFIQCVGSRDERYLSYCSDVCCMVSIKQALTLKEMNPNNEIYIFYNDIRTPGEYEELYQRARRSGVIFIKGIPSELKEGENGKVSFSVFDTIAGERIDHTFDLAVLATGMRPSESNMELKEKIGIPLNKNNFLESHLQCYPQDTQREGIFSAGTCRAPMDVSRSIESAGTAAVKAIQFFNSTVEIIPDHPVVNKLKCDVCKRCIEECPFKAFSLDEKGFPEVDIPKCRRCGICLGSCPLTAISFGSLSIEQLSSMLDAIDKSYLGDDEPIVLGFLCKNDAYRAVDDVSLKGISYPQNFLGIMVPCAGTVNGVVVAQAISSGIDGVLVAGCPEDQCHYVKGSALAKVRLKDVSDKLKEMYLEPERVRFVSISRDEPEKFADTVNEYVKELKIMGRNPLRI